MIQQIVKKAMGDWIGAQCEETETYLNKTNKMGADQLMKDLTAGAYQQNSFSLAGRL